ncbi:MAG: ABC transporter permease [Nitriliruptoraceae bacterium]
MNATILVATREFTERLRSRAFLISNGAILGILILALVLPTVTGDDDPVTVGHLSGDAAEVGEIAASQQAAFDVEIELTAIEDRSGAEAALEDGEVAAVLLDATTVLADGGLGPRLEALLANASNAVEIETALAEAGLDPDVRAELFAMDALTVEQLQEGDGVLDAFDPAVIVVFAAVFLLYGLLAVFGQWVAQGIVEEKQSRVVEVLLASLRPTELLAGKVLGLGFLGLLQVLVLTVVGVAGLLLTDVVDVPNSAWGGLALVIPWYVLGFLLYAALFAMGGSVVSRVEDMQSAVMPVIVVLVVALLAAQMALANPGGSIAAVAGVFPLTAPIVQPVLLAMGATSWLQGSLAILLALASIAVLVPVAARIYQGGVLRTRGRVSFRQAWRGT